MALEDVLLAGGISLVAVLESAQLVHGFSMEKRLARIEGYLEAMRGVKR